MSERNIPNDSRPDCYGYDYGKGPQGRYCFVCCGALQRCADALIMNLHAAESVRHWQWLPWYTRLWYWAVS